MLFTEASKHSQLVEAASHLIDNAFWVLGPGDVGGLVVGYLNADDPTCIRIVSTREANRVLWNGFLTKKEIVGNGIYWKIKNQPNDYARFCAPIVNSALEEMVIIDRRCLISRLRPGDMFWLVGFSGEPPMNVFFRFLDQASAIPLLESWSGPIWKAGREENWIRQVVGTGMSGWECDLPSDGLELFVSQAIRKGILPLPPNPDSETDQDKKMAVVTSGK